MTTPPEPDPGRPTGSTPPEQVPQVQAPAAAAVLLVLGGVGGWAIFDQGHSSHNVQFPRPRFGHGQRHFPGQYGNAPRNFPQAPSATPTPSFSATS